MDDTARMAKWIRLTEPNSQGRLRAIAAARSHGNSFVIKCDDPGQGSVYVHLIVPHALGGDFDERAFEYSIDGGQVVTETWTYLAHDVCLLGRTAGFLRAIRNATLFECTVLDAAGKRYRCHFDIGGAAAAIDFVSAVCEQSLRSEVGPPSLTEREALDVGAQRRLAATKVRD